MVGLFGLLFILAAVPQLQRLTGVGQPLGPVVGALGGIAVVFGMLATCVGAIWHAAVHPPFISDGQRITVILLLIFGNVFAGMFYYFGYVYWRRKADVRNAAV